MADIAQAEMVNPDSHLYRAHPDWVLHFPARPRTQMRHQLILDFGRSEVVEAVYAMRLLADGELVHVGFGPAQPAATVAVPLDNLDQYEEPNYVWEKQGRRWEYPAFGDVTTHDGFFRKLVVAV